MEIIQFMKLAKIISSAVSINLDLIILWHAFLQVMYFKYLAQINEQVEVRLFKRIAQVFTL